MEKLIIRLRRERMTIRSIAGATGVSRATTARICGRHGLSRLTSIDPPPAPRRYERSRPGELVHIDVKKLGQFDGEGHRVTRSRSTGSPGLGWEFLHVATDDFSRLTYAEILSDERKATVTGFLTRSVRWFGKRGVAVTGIMTDNARTYRSIPFRDACRELQIRSYVRPRPATPHFSVFDPLGRRKAEVTAPASVNAAEAVLCSPRGLQRASCPRHGAIVISTLR